MKFRNHLYIFLGIVIFLISFVFYIDQFWKYKSAILNLQITPLVLSIFLGCVFIYVATVFFGGYLWYTLIRSHNISIPPQLAISIYAITQMGKYIPGNMGHIVSRPLFAMKAKIPLIVSISSIFTELIWTSAVALNLSFLHLLIFFDQKIIFHMMAINKHLMVILGLVLIFIPWIVIAISNKYFHKLIKKMSNLDKISFPKISSTLLALFLIVISYFFIAIIMKLQAEYFFGVKNINVFELMCLFSLIWLIGFLVPGAPGGLGVRESLIVIILTPSWGGPAAVALSVTLRFTCILGDALAFFLGIYLNKRALSY